MDVPFRQSYISLGLKVCVGYLSPRQGALVERYLSPLGTLVSIVSDVSDVSIVSVRNYSGTFLAPPAVALGKEGDVARTPRAPAGGLRPIGANLRENL